MNSSSGPVPQRRQRKRWAEEEDEEGESDDDLRKTKERRMQKKRQLGMEEAEEPARRVHRPSRLSDSDESEVEEKEELDLGGAVSGETPKDLGHKVTRVREDLREKEYSDDEEELAEVARRSARDSWLDEVDSGAGNASFESEAKRQKLLRAREDEHRKLEERLEQRVDAHLSDLEKVRRLINLLVEDNMAPNDLMRKIKDEAQAGSVQGAKKKGWRPSRLPPDFQRRMDEIIELCDGLMLTGTNVYSEPRSRLRVLAGQMEQTGGRKMSHDLMWLFRRSPQEPVVGPFTLAELAEQLENMSSEEQGQSQIQQVTADSEPLDGLWVGTKTVDWKLTQREVT